MKITNKFGLPQPIVDAVKNDEYTRGDSDISVTQLIDSPRMVTLEARHEDELEEDVVDRVWALFGTSVHKTLEQADTTGVTEQRLYTDIEGWTISGSFDRLALVGDALTLQDYKVTTAFTIKKKNRIAIWTAQLNCYAALARIHGHEIQGLQVVAFLRDWAKARSLRENDYPPNMISVVNIHLWAHEDAIAYMGEQVRAHQSARNDKLPLCTDKQRWIDPDKYAVMKKGRTRALRVLDSRASAVDWMQQNGHASLSAPDVTFKAGYGIEVRKAPPRRCIEYCAVLQFCDQAKEEGLA